MTPKKGCALLPRIDNSRRAVIIMTVMAASPGRVTMIKVDPVRADKALASARRLSPRMQRQRRPCGGTASRRPRPIAPE